MQSQGTGLRQSLSQQLQSPPERPKTKRRRESPATAPETDIFVPRKSPRLESPVEAHRVVHSPGPTPENQIWSKHYGVVKGTTILPANPDVVLVSPTTMVTGHRRASVARYHTSLGAVFSIPQLNPQKEGDSIIRSVDLFRHMLERFLSEDTQLSEALRTAFAAKLVEFKQFARDTLILRTVLVRPADSRGLRPKFCHSIAAIWHKRVRELKDGRSLLFPIGTRDTGRAHAMLLRVQRHGETYSVTIFNTGGSGAMRLHHRHLIDLKSFAENDNQLSHALRVFPFHVSHISRDDLAGHHGYTRWYKLIEMQCLPDVATPEEERPVRALTAESLIYRMFNPASQLGPKSGAMQERCFTGYRATAVQKIGNCHLQVCEASLKHIPNLSKADYAIFQNYLERYMLSATGYAADYGIQPEGPLFERALEIHQERLEKRRALPAAEHRAELSLPFLENIQAARSTGNTVLFAEWNHALNWYIEQVLMPIHTSMSANPILEPYLRQLLQTDLLRSHGIVTLNDVPRSHAKALRTALEALEWQITALTKTAPDNISLSARSDSFVSCLEMCRKLQTLIRW